MSEKRRGESGHLAEALLDGINAINRQLRRVPVPRGMSRQRIAVLTLLNEHGAVSVTRLAALADVRPPTMSRMTGELVAKGLARKSDAKHDARGVMIRITPKGRRACEGARRKSADYVRTALAELSGERVAALLELARALGEIAPGAARSDGQDR